MSILDTLSNLVQQTGFANLTWGNYVMIAVALVFLYLAIAKDYEPLLLVPIAFGMLLVNIYPDIMLNPADSSNGTGGLLYYFYTLDKWSILPSLIFMGVGALTDFGPLIANPISFLMGAAASSVSTSRISSRSSWASTESPQLLFPSSAVLTARHPFSLRQSSDRQVSWDRSPSRHIPICPSSRSSSRRS